MACQDHLGVKHVTQGGQAHLQGLKLRSCNGLQPNSNGLQPTSDGIQPNSICWSDMDVLCVSKVDFKALLFCPRNAPKAGSCSSDSRLALEPVVSGHVRYGENVAAI